MARKVLNDVYYTFTPSTKTITIPRIILRERLILIINVTTNQVIYNFSDPSLKATSFSTSNSPAPGTTTIVLQYNTASMSSSDKLQIIIDEYDEKFTPSEVYTDPVNKFRTSSPQALIDTDFEYSTQATKWESLGMINNRPFAFFNTTTSLSFTGITAAYNSPTITVATSSPPSVGSTVFIQDTIFGGADGLFVVDTVSAGTNFTYTARTPYTGSSGTISVSGQTIIYAGSLFTGSAIGTPTTASVSGQLTNLTFSSPHGLVVGNPVALTGFTMSSGLAPNGSWYVAGTPSPLIITVACSFNIGTYSGFGTVYARPLAAFNHRPFDGGVVFSTNSADRNEQAIRQTRRYFRYQSGKGIQMSTGTIFKPNLNIDRIESSGTLVTVYTKNLHNIRIGAAVTVINAVESAYNGTFTVTNVLDNYRFQYTALSTPIASPASGLYIVSVNTWTGGTVRTGLFDSQNGVFFEYDGTTLYAVRRSSTYQISGFCTVTNGSNSVTGQTINGANTLFARQLIPGDFVVIRGMTYKVESILSDTSMNITPAYRGSSSSNIIVSKTVDVKIPQSQWNIDRCDGTGQSGFNIDLTKMQMFYVDYSWYGAGFIRWGFRGPNGDVVYCHKLINNNTNTEAYMRSGNLPGRYEINSFNKNSIMTQNVLISESSNIYVSDIANWPSSGTVHLNNSTHSEYITYTGISQDYSYPFTLAQGNSIASGTNTTGLAVGNVVYGAGIAAGTTIVALTNNTNITLSVPATFGGTQTLLFNPRLTGIRRGQYGGALTFTTTANSTVATGASTVGVQVGQIVVGTGIAQGTTVESLVSNTSITLSSVANASGSPSLTFTPMGMSAQNWISSNNLTSATLHTTNYAPALSHWGTSVIMDGRYDDDKSFVFTLGSNTALSITAGATNAVLSLRIAPSVSNGVAGSIVGAREIINRMQLVLRQLDFFSNGQYLVSVVLNGTVSSSTPNWQSVGGSSLAQYIVHTSGTTITGGETIYGFFLDSAGGTNFTATNQDLTLVRDLGTSILGGGVAAANSGIYPDGPDIITLMARNIGATTTSIFSRISWTEAQA